MTGTSAKRSRLTFITSSTRHVFGECEACTGQPAGAELGAGQALHAYASTVGAVRLCSKPLGVRLLGLAATASVIAAW